jgi:20S proteasome alpha/beta subunit
MTLILGLRCHGGVVLASDSQRTEGELRDSITKLFSTPAGILWGTAGAIPIQQELWALLRELDVPASLPRYPTRDAIAKALPEAVRRATQRVEDPTAMSTMVEGMFAWHSAHDGRDFLLKALGDGQAVFEPRYTAIGSPSPRNLARFSLGCLEHLDFATLPLEAGKMVALSVAEDTIRATPYGVGLPVQMAVVAAAGYSVIDETELRGLEDTLAAFRENQRNFLVRPGPEEGAGPDTGLRP